MNWTRFLTMAALLAASEFAAAEEEGQYIEEVIVTATYRETSLMDTPLSVSAANADVIEQLGATSLDGLFRTLPGAERRWGPFRFQSNGGARYLVANRYPVVSTDLFHSRDLHRRHADDIG